MKFLKVVYLFLFIYSAKIHAQTNFSELFLNISRSNHLLIPSNVCLENKLQFDAGNKTYLGKLSIIKSYYSNVNFVLKGQEQNQSNKFRKHVLGLGFFKEEEGQYFNRARAFANYSLHLRLSSKYVLATGANLSLINYAFDASSSGAFGSDMAFTGCLSAILYSPSLKLGLAFNDLNNPSLRPISYVFTLNRFLSLYTEKVLEVDESLKIKFASRINYSFENTYSAILQGGLVFSDVAGANIFYYKKKGLGFIFDIYNIEVAKSKLNCSFTFFVPKKDVLPNVNQIEISLSYFIP